VAPLLTGADWYEFSTKNYTGWPSADNPFMNPTPTPLHPGDRPSPDPGGLTAAANLVDGRVPPGRAPAGRGAAPRSGRQGHR
jgi:hypothetical protein